MQISSTNPVYLLTGGNLGQRQKYLAGAKEAIGQQCGIITQASPLYETEAWGTNAAAYLNQALQLQTTLSPRNLLHRLLSIEESLGRVRTHRYSDRTIDIDILLFGDRIISETGLTIPHPQLQHRRFALQCLVHIAPQIIHPVLGKNIKQLLQECTDTLWAKPFLDVE